MFDDNAIYLNGFAILAIISSIQPANCCGLSAAPCEEIVSLELIDNLEMWIQKQFSLPAKSRGFHLITREVLEHIPEIKQLRVGLLHLFIQHTSASLTINENADPDVRTDMETVFNQLAPEKGLPLVHTIEGPDDMPAHVKAALLGASTSIPIALGQLALGTWQGIYLCEHRNHGGPRRFVATITGE